MSGFPYGTTAWHEDSASTPGHYISQSPKKTETSQEESCPFSSEQMLSGNTFISIPTKLYWGSQILEWHQINILLHHSVQTAVSFLGYHQMELNTWAQNWKENRNPGQPKETHRITNEISQKKNFQMGTKVSPDGQGQGGPPSLGPWSKLTSKSH